MVLVAFWLYSAAGNDGGLHIDVHDSASRQWRLLHGALRSRAQQRARGLSIAEYFLAWGGPPVAAADCLLLLYVLNNERCCWRKLLFDPGLILLVNERPQNRSHRHGRLLRVCRTAG